MSLPKACCLNGTKLYRKGKRNETMWNYIRDNTRVAEPCHGRSRGADRFGRTGRASGSRNCWRPMARTRCFRRPQPADGLYREHAAPRIAKIPDGEYLAEGWLDDDGRNRGKTLPVKVTVRVRGDGVEVDLTGSVAAGPHRLQRAVRRLDQGRRLLRLPQAAARYLPPLRVTSRRTRARSGRSR